MQRSRRTKRQARCGIVYFRGYGKERFLFRLLWNSSFQHIRLGVDHTPAGYLLSLWVGRVDRGCSAKTDWVTGLADKVSCSSSDATAPTLKIILQYRREFSIAILQVRRRVTFQFTMRANAAIQKEV
jgi:hypothetical protein